MKRKFLKSFLLATIVASVTVGCGSLDTQQVEKENNEHVHAYVDRIKTDATCEVDGLKVFECECGDSYEEVITATGHVFENYVSNEDATYLADGTETGTCVCGLTDVRIAEGSKLEYTYTDLEQVMYAKQTVNVRDLPTADGNKLGGLSWAEEVRVTGQCNETSWYRIEFGNEVAYVSDSYLVTTQPQKTVAQNTQSTPEPAPTPQPTPEPEQTVTPPSEEVVEYGPDELAVINAGYYNVIVTSQGNYAVLVKDTKDQSNGRAAIEAFLAELGLEPGHQGGGHWIDIDKGYYYMWTDSQVPGSDINWNF